MRTRDDIQTYLNGSGFGHEEVAEGTWLVRHGSDGEHIVVRVEEDLLLFRLKVLERSRIKDENGLYQELLTLNAGEMIHGAYGLADGAVVITAAMLLATVDMAEFRNTIEDFTLAFQNHREVLASFC